MNLVSSESAHAHRSPSTGASSTASSDRHGRVFRLLAAHGEGDMISSYDFGANSFIVKAVDADQFMKSVQDVGRYWLLLNRAPE